MYAGTTVSGRSGNMIGVHQRIDQVARRHIASRLPGGVTFPSIRAILHFEGNNGPDGIKRKSPSQDEPWHFIDPSSPSDTALLDMIDEHYRNLVDSLRAGEQERAAFEAAWLAHAITDGLTPAHHYPLADKILELWGKPKEARQSVLDKNLIKGDGAIDTIAKNWEYWGAKGVFMTHGLFELGVATSIRTARFRTIGLTDEVLVDAMQRGLRDFIRQQIQMVYTMNMYETFWKHGWTTSLARQTRQQLIPVICRTVAVTWLVAATEASRG